MEDKTQTWHTYKNTDGVPDVILRITTEVPRYETTARQAVMMDAEASKLEAVLYHTLPGGIYDRLFAKMAARAASVFVVSKNEAQGGRT